jgi:hypothetical protein
MQRDAAGTSVGQVSEDSNHTSTLLPCRADAVEVSQHRIVTQVI